MDLIERIKAKENGFSKGQRKLADYILKDNLNVVNIFLYSDNESKVQRAIKYYDLDEKNALKEINRINNLPLHLVNNTFSQQEIDQINASNFANNLSN